MFATAASCLRSRLATHDSLDGLRKPDPHSPHPDPNLLVRGYHRTNMQRYAIGADAAPHTRVLWVIMFARMRACRLSANTDAPCPSG